MSRTAGFSYLHDHVKVGDARCQRPGWRLRADPDRPPLLAGQRRCTHSAAHRRTHRSHATAAEGDRRPRRPQSTRSRAARNRAASRARDRRLPPTPGTKTSMTATPARVKASSTCPTSHFPMTSRPVTCGPLPSGGLSGRRCSIEECQRRESAMRSSGLDLWAAQSAPDQGRALVQLELRCNRAPQRTSFQVIPPIP